MWVDATWLVRKNLVYETNKSIYDDGEHAINKSYNKEIFRDSNYSTCCFRYWYHTLRIDLKTIFNKYFVLIMNEHVILLTLWYSNYIIVSFESKIAWNLYTVYMEKKKPSHSLYIIITLFDVNDDILKKKPVPDYSHNKMLIWYWMQYHHEITYENIEKVKGNHLVEFTRSLIFPSCNLL